MPTVQDLLNGTVFEGEHNLSVQEDASNYRAPWSGHVSHSTNDVNS
jgi:hypothetical protein